MNLAGAAGGGADALTQLLTQEFAKRQQIAAAERAQQELDLRRTAEANDQAYRTGQTERQARMDTQASDRQSLADSNVRNQQGMRHMIGDFLTQRGNQQLDPQTATQLSGMAFSEGLDIPELPKAAPRKVITTVGPRGAPLSKSFTEDELAQGVPEYRAPEKERTVPVETVDSNGNAVTQYLPESQVSGKTFQRPAKTRGPIGQERSALAFYNRGKQASDTITGSGFEEQYAKAGLMSQAQGQLPNVMQSKEQQSYRQAQRAFTEARLRKESGAAVPQQEYDNDSRTYFAVPGDDDATIQQKRQARQAVLDGIGFQAGPAYEEYYGTPFQKNAAGVNGGGGLGGKTITRAQLSAIATRNGVSADEAARQAQAQGYTVQ